MCLFRPGQMPAWLRAHWECQQIPNSHSLSVGAAFKALAAKSRHFASCQFSIAFKRTGEQWRWRWRWEMGKWKWKRRFRNAFPHSHSDSHSHSLSFQFHLALAFILDLHLIWLDCHSVVCFSSVCLFSTSPSTSFLRSARQKTHKYLCDANATKKFDRPFANE